MRLQPIDFLAPPGRPPRAGVLILAIGIALLAAAFALQRHWDLQRERAQAEAQRRAEALRAASATQVKAAPSADDLREARAQLERRRPWLPALRAVETATRDPVYLLGLSIDAGTGTVRLEAEAPSFDQALKYVQDLPDGAGLVSAQLLSHQLTNDVAANRQMVRFTVSAQWSTP